jgi:ABC-type uncharacterized transport system permease subunit
MLLLSIVVFIVVFVLYMGNSIRYRFGSSKEPTPFWRLSITRGVLLAACVAVVSVTMLKNHFILAGALAFVFAVVAWIAGRDVVVDKSERMDTFYRSLARVDAANSNQRWTGGPVGRWASTLRKEDYAVVAGRVADAAKRSDEAGDEVLREIYDHRSR